MRRITNQRNPPTPTIEPPLRRHPILKRQTLNLSPLGDIRHDPPKRLHPPLRNPLHPRHPLLRRRRIDRLLAAQEPLPVRPRHEDLAHAVLREVGGDGEEREPEEGVRGRVAGLEEERV